MKLSGNYENRRAGDKPPGWSPRWDTDPPAEFIRWWEAHGSDRRDIKPRIAWNCELYRKEYSEAKGIGAV